MRISGWVLACVCACSAALGGEVRFSSKPAATRTNGKATITFTVSAPTNVEVTVLDAGGKVVRHLAAGVLGGEKAPPEPLEPGLSQSIAWDGKDDIGRPASRGCSVRVRLGMRAELDGFIGESKHWVSRALGMATDEKGHLYVYSATIPRGSGGYGWIRYLQVFTRDGEYLRTIMPMPANLPREKLLPFNTSVSSRKGKVVLDVPGEHFQPRNYWGTWPVIYPGLVGRLAPSVTEDGVLFTSDGHYIARVRSDGSAVDAVVLRRLWPEKKNGSPGKYAMGPRQVVPSPDGKWLYMSGICRSLKRGGDPGLKVHPVFPDGRIYRMDLAKPGAVLEKFVDLPHPANVREFSEVNKGFTSQDYYRAKHPGVDKACCDRDGNLFVCDRMNAMIRVYSPAGKEIGGFKVEYADSVAVHGETGVVYVMTNKWVKGGCAEKKLLKFSSWKKSATQMASFEFPSAKGYEADMVLDDSAEPPVLWCGGDLTGKRSLLRIEDRGSKFVVTRDLMDLNKDRFGVKPRMAVHPETDLVVCNDGSATLNGYDGLTGKRVTLPFEYGADMGVGLDGNWYVQTGKGYSGYICRFTRDMKPIPVKDPPTGRYKGRKSEKTYGKPIPNALGYVYGRMGAGFCTVGLAADTKGRCYSMQMYSWCRYAVAVYGPDGHPEDPGRLKGDPKMKDVGRFESVLVGPLHTTCGGLQLDWKGNVYVGLGVRPVGYKLPAGFEKDDAYRRCVGSVVRFGPTGGGLYAAGKKSSRDAFSHRPPAGTKGLKLQGCKRYGDVVLAENADAVYPELGCISGGYGTSCMCRQPMFQVDGWGRLFIPNAITSSVRIVDNAGNLIQKFGHYGNIDSRGPGEDSMIKTPAVPLAWPEAVAASYKAVYVSDVLNRRIVRMKKVYDAEETCAIQ
ncbi:MAG: hypothetical protein ACYTGB_04650 [Planctomycetota bacterium]|jgi:hypothetical protein